jgi:SAM-dependent methyltransferase
MDPLVEFKENQKAAWSNFVVLESLTATAAPALVRWAGIKTGDAVLDVACGTGVVALTAARLGARVTGVDLTPELVARARENAALMQLEGTWLEGDAEALPVGDASFDVVVSQFGHMFAPRPEVAVAEMLRVLKPGGTLAFATWPPELFTGRSFALMGRYAPPPPPGVASPVKWGDPAIVGERLGDRVRDLVFTRDTMFFQALSPQHAQQFFEKNFGPAIRLYGMLEASDPARAQALRRESAELAAQYFQDCRVRQDFLLTRAIKA